MTDPDPVSLELVAAEHDAMIARLRALPGFKAMREAESPRAETDCACKAGGLEDCPCEADGPDGLCACCRAGPHDGSCADPGRERGVTGG